MRDEFPDAELFRITTEPTTDSTVSEEEKWLTDMHQFLSSRLPPDKMDWDERKRLAVRSCHFCLIQDTLYHKGVDRICRRAVRSDKKETIIREAHCGIAGGHYAGDATTQKIWKSGLRWPTTLKDAIRYSKECVSVNDKVRQRSRPECLITRSYHWNHSRNGGWISSYHLNHRQ